MIHSSSLLTRRIDPENLFFSLSGIIFKSLKRYSCSFGTWIDGKRWLKVSKEIGCRDVRIFSEFFSTFHILFIRADASSTFECKTF